MPRLLILNWRDPWHPKAGGAELLILRLAEGLVRRNWSVEWFSGMYPRALSSESKGGIAFVRKGSQLTVHLEACRFYGSAPSFEYVVDCVNTVPFFTPLYSHIPKIALFCQLAREVWFYEAAFPTSLCGYVSELVYLQAYRKVPIITISRSSADSLRKIGLAGEIHVIPVAVDEPPDVAVPLKDAKRNLVVLSRLAPSKRIEECIKGAAIMVDNGWSGTLLIMGSGDCRYRGRLEKLVDSYNLNGRVRFLGRVNDSERTFHLRDASAIWMTSVREGWGLVITEAARHGTPAVVYDVPGLRDSVINNVTGFVVEARPEQLAKATLRLFSFPQRDMFAAALANSLKHTWHCTTSAFEGALVQSAR